MLMLSGFYSLQMHPEWREAEILKPHQNEGVNEKLSHDSGLGRQGGKWEIVL